MCQGQTVADYAEVAVEVAGEARERSQTVLFGIRDPPFQVVTAAAGHHGGELPDVTGEPVEFRIALTQPVQLVGVLAP